MRDLCTIQPQCHFYHLRTALSFGWHLSREPSVSCVLCSNAVLRKINALHEKLALIGEGGFEEAVSRRQIPVRNDVGARRGICMSVAGRKAQPAAP